MELTIEEMRAICVTHYVERGYSPDHADLIVPTDEKEIRRIYRLHPRGTGKKD